MPTLVVVVASDGSVTLVNEEFGALTGWSPTAIRGRSWIHSIISKPCREQAAAFFGREQSSAPDFDPVFEVATPNGDLVSIRWTDRIEFPTDLADGAHLYVGALCREVRAGLHEGPSEDEGARDLLDAVSTFACLYDVKGHLRDVNQATLEASGLTREDVLDSHFAKARWWKGIPNSLRIVEGAMARALGGEAVTERFDVAFHSSGSTPVECTFKPRRNPDGEVIGVIVTGSDVTEARRLYSQFRDERDRLAQAQRIANIGSWELDHRDGRLSWSDQVYKMFCVSREEVEPSYEGFLERVHPADRASVDRAYAQSISDQAPYEIVHRVQPVDGSVIWVREQCETTFDGAGAPILSRGTVQDITEQYTANQKLAVSQSTLSGILNTNPEALIVIGQSMEILMFSTGAEQMFRCSASDMIGRHFHELMPERLRSRHAMHMHKFERDGLAQLRMSERTEILALRADGEEFSADASVAKASSSNGHVYTVILHDMTARKSYEDALKRAKVRAESASIAQSAFLANMSHEIRTPMIGVLGMLSALEGSLVTDKQRRMIGFALESGRSLMEILNDLLEFSKIEAGAIRFDQSEFDIRTLVEHVAAVHTPGAEQKGLALMARIDPAVPKHAVGDAARLERILHNLVSNAVKFTPNGRVDVDVTRAGEAGLAGVLCIQVKDTGIGLNEAECEMIFDRFVQADATNTRKFGGTGLGLAIVKSLAEGMGGGVEVQSTPDAGSTFTVTVPLQPVHLEEGRVQERSGFARAGRILVVEDNVLNAETLQYMIAEHGLECDIAQDGEMAITAVQRETYDVVLMDIQMPKLDGLEALKVIRELERDCGEAPVKIVACSADVHDGRMESYLEAGFDDVLPKPIRAAALAGILGQKSFSEVDDA